MHELKFVLLGVVILKICSGYWLNHKQSENELARSFIEYKFEEQKNLSQLLRHNIKDELRTDSAYWYEVALFNKLKNNVTLETTPSEYLSFFNNSKLRSLLGFAKIQFKENPILTKEQNKVELKDHCYGHILTHLDSIYTQFHNERPYLCDLEVYGDSMVVHLEYARESKAKDISLYYDGKEYILDSFPINLGPLSGPIKYCFNDQLYNEKRCYEQEF